jgi:yopX protein
MNREILFRAKCSGLWRYGNYVHLDKKPIHDCYNNEYKDFIVVDEVDGGYYYPITELSSIEQYTGLKDKNGKKIFEGDIVHIQSDGYDLSEVEVDIHRIVSFYDGAICLSVGDWLHVPIGEYIHGLEDWDIVGNVIDTPELMK